MHTKLFISLESRVDGDVTNKKEKVEEGGNVGLAAGKHEEDGTISKAASVEGSVGMDGGTTVGGLGGGTGSRAPTPPAPTSVPVRTPFTAEDTVNLGSLVERKDDDLSLIVHVDDTLDNDTLDNDILGTPMRNATNDADIQMDAERAEEEAENVDGKAGGGVGVGGPADEKVKDATTAVVVDDGDNKENTATPAPSIAQTSGVTDTANNDQKKDADAEASKTDAKKDAAGSDNKTKRLVCITLTPTHSHMGTQ